MKARTVLHTHKKGHVQLSGIVVAGADNVVDAVDEELELCSEPTAGATEGVVTRGGKLDADSGGSSRCNE